MLIYRGLQLAIIALSLSSTSNAQFILSETIPNSRGYWYARTDDGWLSTFNGQWAHLDDDFNVRVAVGPFPDVRGIDWDPLRQYVSYVEPFVQRIGFATIDGVYVDSFDVPYTVNDLSIDPITGDIWLASFDGTIRKVDREGNLLSSLSVPFNLTGVAVDPLRDKLFFVTYNSNETFDDEVYEVDYDGSNYSLVIPSGTFERGDGLGLEYVPTTETLYLTGPSDRIYVFQRVPEPTTWFLLYGSVPFMLGSRRRCR